MKVGFLNWRLERISIFFIYYNKRVDIHLWQCTDKKYAIYGHKGYFLILRVNVLRFGAVFWSFFFNIIIVVNLIFIFFFFFNFSCTMLIPFYIIVLLFRE